MREPESYTFEPDGSFPNSRLAVLADRSAMPADTDTMTRALAANGWLTAWVNGIFAYHHFHSIAHGVLGIASGEVDVLPGGPSGCTVRLAVGDVVVIPAGVAHRNGGQPGRLLVVGAYPGGADYDIKRVAPGEFATAWAATWAAARSGVSP